MRRLVLLIICFSALAATTIWGEEAQRTKTYNSLGEVLRVEGRMLHLRIPRGHGGIIVQNIVGEDTEIRVTGEDGKLVEGRLEDLKPGQWLRMVVETDTRRLLRIEPGVAPWERRTPAESGTR